MQFPFRIRSDYILHNSAVLSFRSSPEMSFPCRNVQHQLLLEFRRLRHSPAHPKCFLSCRFACCTVSSPPYCDLKEREEREERRLIKMHMLSHSFPALMFGGRRRNVFRKQCLSDCSLFAGSHNIYNWHAGLVYFCRTY